MLFSSYEFMLFFLPIVLTGYFLVGPRVGKTIAHLWLVLASLVFYGWFNPAYLWIILSSVIVNYAVVRLIERCRIGGHARRAVFTLGILFNLGLIGYYKYADFLIENSNALLRTEFPALHILLPLGISFFTFQQISCVVDAYKGVALANLSFVNYALFVTFFPQLVAGPIVHHQEMMPQFDRPDSMKPTWPHLACGLHILSIGLFKKLVIADQLAVWATRGFSSADQLTFIQAWFVALAYMMQLYFDFSGYCDMALGIGKMFNIHLPINFNSPYRATSIRDFWLRWHITLGRFLSHYVYKPLGGSRGGTFRTCLNLLLTFLISGLWHGAGWTYVLFGGLHGVVLVIHRLWNGLGFSMHRRLGRALTFLFFMVSLVLFRADSVGAAMRIWRGLVSFSTIMSEHGIREIVRPGFTVRGSVILLAVLIVVCLTCKNAAKRSVTFRPTRLRLAETILFLTWSILTMSRISPFIYFNF
jgi:D-alanyl-lipoteichoic acid acyltransferase DltB (MBOAT superfamily)